MELQVKENRGAVFKGGELTDNFLLIHGILLSPLPPTFFLGGVCVIILESFY